MAAALWLDQRPTLERGLKLLKKLWPNRIIMEILPAKLDPLGDHPLTRFKGAFPLTLPSLTRRLVLGKRLPQADGVILPNQLWALGTIARSGLPLTLMPITIQGFHYLVPPGLKLKNVLDSVNLKPLPGDAVILGGLITGGPTARLDRGLRSFDLAVHLLRRANLPGPPGACRRCSLCRRACPLDLPIDLLGQTPSSDWFKRIPPAKKALAGCAGCGACALACPARLPLLSLARAAGASDPYGRGISQPQTRPLDSTA
jgi:Na+-translocating ferredoxin:NAD+ oxidoreductase RnfC subunit